jgi:hypothetical protein
MKIPTSKMKIQSNIYQVCSSAGLMTVNAWVQVIKMIFKSYLNFNLNFLL